MNNKTKAPMSLTHEVAERIRSAIISAEFDLGEAISEDSLAIAMGISRTPVREAMRILQMEGLVDVKPKYGTFVFNPTEDEIFELCEFRVTLEVRASSLSMSRASSETLESLHEALAAMQKAQDAGNMQGYSIADTAFHNSFLQYCGNRYLRHSYATSLARVSALRTHLAVSGEAEPTLSFADHKRITELFEQKKEDLLSELIEQHVLRTRTHYLRALANRARETMQNTSRMEQMRRKLGMNARS